MTDKPQAKTIIGAFFDFIILCLLLAGAGFGGYVVGINQKFGPIQLVPTGTLGAITIPGGEKAKESDTSKTAESAKHEKADKAKPEKGAEKSTEKSSEKSAEKSSEKSDENSSEDKTAESDSESTSESTSQSTNRPSSGKKLKYWLCSSGADYTGYSITVKVNGTAVDNFFGPGKSVDITRLVKHGENSITYEAKALGDQYNKHSGEANYILAVKLVKGPVVQEEFASKDVVLIYARNASETEDFNETKHFKGD